MGLRLISCNEIVSRSTYRKSMLGYGGGHEVLKTIGISNTDQTPMPVFLAKIEYQFHLGFYIE